MQDSFVGEILYEGPPPPKGKKKKKEEEEKRESFLQHIIKDLKRGATVKVLDKSEERFKRALIEHGIDSLYNRDQEISLYLPFASQGVHKDDYLSLYPYPYCMYCF